MRRRLEPMHIRQRIDLSKSFRSEILHQGYRLVRHYRIQQASRLRPSLSRPSARDSSAKTPHHIGGCVSSHHATAAEPQPVNLALAEEHFVTPRRSLFWGLRVRVWHSMLRSHYAHGLRGSSELFHCQRHLGNGLVIWPLIVGSKVYVAGSHL